MALVQVTNIYNPTVFDKVEQQLTETKSRLVTSGLVERSAVLDSFMVGPGNSVEMPKFRDLSDDVSIVATDATGDSITPLGNSTDVEIGVKLSRAQAWSSAQLAATLSGTDPLGMMAARVSNYWQRELQRIFIATMTGVFADNDAAPSGSEHTAGDLTIDITDTYDPGVTDFSAEAFIDACGTLGDSEEDIVAVAMHSVVYNKALKNNLIDFVSDSANPNATRFATFLGRAVIVDDGLTKSSNDYDTWLFGRGALVWGSGQHPKPSELDSSPAQGNGFGVETLYTRKIWCLHPVGHKYAGTLASGGPSNAGTANNLAHADSWMRVLPQRKMIKIARLRTTEA